MRRQLPGRVLTSLSLFYSVCAYTVANNIISFSRLYEAFTMETILATTFSRIVEVQRGESDELTEAAVDIFEFARKNLLLVQCIMSEF